MLPWSVELGEFDIQYQPRPTIKSQVLADFVVQCTMTEIVTEGADTSQQALEEIDKEIWRLFVDGASNPEGSGAGLMIVSPDNLRLKYALRLNFKASNNEAEYEALLAGLRVAKQLKVRSIIVLSDSQLVVRQMQSQYEAREPRMARYLTLAKALASEFSEFQIQQIPQEDNAMADELSHLAASVYADLGYSIFIETLGKPSVEMETAHPVGSSPSWMDEIIAYLQNQVLPIDKKEARKLLSRASTGNCTRGAIAYHCSDVYQTMRLPTFFGKFMKEFVDSTREAGPWPTKSSDKAISGRPSRKTPKSIPKKCKECQMHARKYQQPASIHTPIYTSIPFDT